jgi:hypothetical protein
MIFSSGSDQGQRCTERSSEKSDLEQKNQTLPAVAPLFSPLMPPSGLELIWCCHDRRGPPPSSLPSTRWKLQLHDMPARRHLATTTEFLSVVLARSSHASTQVGDVELTETIYHRPLPRTWRRQAKLQPLSHHTGESASGKQIGS